MKLRRPLRCVAFLLLALCTWSPIATAEETLLPFGSSWRYLDDGVIPPANWIDSAFDDTSWQVGPAQLGYGDGDEATVIGFGPDPDDKPITAYFRTSFSIVDPAAYDGITMRLIRDDGAVIYLNGIEVFRSNLPAGPITTTTLAASTISGSEEDTQNLAVLSPNSLVSGSNVIAVELHQRDSESSDLSLDLELRGHTASDPIEILRGPYLQRIGNDRAVFRWRTNAFTSSRVGIGTSPTNLDTITQRPGLFSDHEVEITGLPPGTSFSYAIGDAIQWLSGPDAEHRFSTYPPAPTSDPIRVWAIGDSGTADANATAVRDAYLAFSASEGTDLWLMLGDNAYDAGTDNEYQAAVFDMFPGLLKQGAVWPTLGNHDGRTASLTGEGPYFDMFTLPTAGESGGLASGTEAYYSFDYANVHFVCLDSEGSSLSVGGAMLTWLDADLASTDREWIIAFWHHPPYSDGSHDSDDPTDSSGRLFAVRENVLPILEEYGADLILCGHSHSYERSMLLNGHHGVSSTLTSSMILDGGDGDPAGDGPYQKPAETTPYAGAVYVVAGSSGKVDDSPPLSHPALPIGLAQLGSVVLDIQGPRLDARFLRSNGTVTDTFSIIKGSFFIRGDANGDGALDVADPITMIDYLFQGASTDCEVALDANDDESINIADPIAVLSTLFSGASLPPAPHPTCGVDPTPGLLVCASPSCP